jgi:hypothetical protein
MNRKEFNKQIRRLMLRAYGRDLLLCIAGLMLKALLFESAKTIMDWCEEGLATDKRELAALMQARQEASANTLRA